MTLQIDGANQTFDLLIDGELVIDDAAFRSPLVGGVSRIEWYANSANYGSAYIDDIRILQGTDRDRSNAGITSITTDAGEPARSGDTWLLNVAAATTEFRATVTPTAAVVSGITIDGVSAEPGQASAPIALDEGSTRSRSW